MPKERQQKFYKIYCLLIILFNNDYSSGFLLLFVQANKQTNDKDNFQNKRVIFISGHYKLHEMHIGGRYTRN